MHFFHCRVLALEVVVPQTCIFTSHFTGHLQQLMFAFPDDNLQTELPLT